jgi:hypothetical protein
MNSAPIVSVPSCPTTRGLDIRPEVYGALTLAGIHLRKARFHYRPGLERKHRDKAEKHFRRAARYLRKGAA